MTLSLTLHNTLSGGKEKFVPMDPKRVTMYQCGPTVYDYVHIGNGRPAVVMDVLYRLLKTQYPEVIHARNVTDIDDKINAAAKRNDEPFTELTDRFIVEYYADIAALNVLPAQVQPRATQHIPQIIQMIHDLIATDHAYANDGHVLFSVPSDPTYGTLSRRTLEELIDGARVDVAPYKKDPKDFVLWKPSTPDLPGWDSPWGWGRPGWHIECSAMIKEHLGETIDIHGGGSDLVFPHHENEAAQSRCANANPDYVRYWVHNGMLTMGQEKMSKSLGNILTINGLRQKHPGQVLRLALLSAQYRYPLAWSDDSIIQANKGIDTFYHALRAVPGDSLGSPEQFQDLPVEAFPASVVDALCDDLNTPLAIAAMHELASQVHKADNEQAARDYGMQLLAGGWLLGLLQTPVESYFQASATVDAAEVEALIAARNQARKDKDFARADEVRDQIANMGIELEDSRDGTRWRVKDS